MYNVEVQIDLRNSGYSSDLETAVNCMTSFWNSSRQIIDEPEGWILTEEMLRFNVLCPEPDALRYPINTSYYKYWMQAIQLLTGALPKWTSLGRDPRYHDYEIPEAPYKSLILLGDRGISQLVCGDTFACIPYYRIPEICDPERGHDDLKSWNNRWNNFYGLWFSGFWEAKAQHQLEAHDSELSQMGRAVAARIEKVTGLPTYYWLFNYREISPADDQARKCPETGQDWYIPGTTTNDTIAFKCDESRLVGELSKNSPSDEEE